MVSFTERPNIYLQLDVFRRSVMTNAAETGVPGGFAAVKRGAE